MRSDFLYLSEDTTGTEIAFLFDKYKLILVVEGKKDSKIYQTLFGKFVFVYSKGGKSNVLDAVIVLGKNLKYRNRFRALGL